MSSLTVPPFSLQLMHMHICNAVSAIFCICSSLCRPCFPGSVPGQLPSLFEVSSCVFFVLALTLFSEIKPSVKYYPGAFRPPCLVFPSAPHPDNCGFNCSRQPYSKLHQGFIRLVPETFLRKKKLLLKMKHEENWSLSLECLRRKLKDQFFTLLLLMVIKLGSFALKWVRGIPPH